MAQLEKNQKKREKHIHDITPGHGTAIDTTSAQKIPYGDLTNISPGMQIKAVLEWYVVGLF
jgi:hypothetical protein